MKKILIVSLLFLSYIGTIGNIQAGFLSDLLDGGNPHIHYCQDDDCGTEEGVKVLEEKLDDAIVTDKKISEYVQDVVIFLIGFLSLVAVIYIIYAGFNIMIGNGDEEKIKQSKTTIGYVILGLFIIYFAYTFVAFIFDVFDTTNEAIGGVIYTIV